jgi:hypothetical protein
LLLLIGPLLFTLSIYRWKLFPPTYVGEVYFTTYSRSMPNFFNFLGNWIK